MNACERLFEALQDRIDGPIDAARARVLDEHLAGCPGCRERELGLRAVRDALRQLPLPPLPDDAWREVLARTVEAPREDRLAAGRRVPWRFVAVAAAVVLAVLLPLAARSWRRPAYSRADLARGRDDVRIALALASRALQRSERIARDEILAGRVSPAVRRIPIHWPKHDPAPERRSKT